MSVTDLITVFNYLSTNFNQTTAIIIIIIVIIIFVLVNRKSRICISSKPKEILNENAISNYFKPDIPKDCKIDFFFYQLGLRKNLPIMDWLYFEYIKFLNKKFPIKKLIIFPTIDMTATSQAQCDFNEFCDNINKIFKSSNIEFDIVDPYKDIYFDKDDLISKDFIETLKYIGSEKYFGYLKKFDIRITSISDFNKFHPNDDKIMNIYTHVYKSWGIINYIKRNIDLTEKVNISAIFWEWEVDKFGVLKHYSGNNMSINFWPVLGITQMLNKTTPIPIFIEDKAIGIFDSKKYIIDKAINFMPFLKKCNLLLESVLSQHSEIKREDIIDNGKILWRGFINQGTQKTERTKPTKDFYLFLGLIAEIRRHLGITW